MGDCDECGPPHKGGYGQCECGCHGDGLSPGGVVRGPGPVLVGRGDFPLTPLPASGAQEATE